MDRQREAWQAQTIKRAMQHQGWLWGVDVRCTGGNGNRLVDFGFTRHPAPESGPKDCVTMYRLAGSDRVYLLWSYGVALLADGEPHAYFVARGSGGVSRIPADTVRDGQWHYDTLTAGLIDGPGTPTDPTLIPDLFRWIGGYERTIQAQVGADARNAELAAWHLAKRRADQLPPLWDTIAERWERLISR